MFDSIREKIEYNDEGTRVGKSAKPIIAALIAIAVVAVILFYYIPYYNTSVVLNEIDSLSPDEATVAAIRTAGCKSLQKTDAYWLVDNCGSDIYFKLFIKPDGNYYLGYCTSWDTQREAFQKLGPALTLGPNTCVDESLEDEYVFIEYYEDYGVKSYNVCGVRAYFRDECIIGTGSI